MRLPRMKIDEFEILKKRKHLLDAKEGKITRNFLHEFHITQFQKSFSLHCTVEIMSHHTNVYWKTDLASLRVEDLFDHVVSCVFHQLVGAFVEEIGKKQTCIVYFRGIYKT